MFARVVDCCCLPQLRVLAGILVWLLMSGCPQAQPPAVAPAPSLNGVTVEFAVPAELHLGEHWQLELEEWSAKTGGEVKLLEVPAIEAASAPPAPATLALVPLRTIPDLISGDWLSPLENNDSAMSDWESVLRGLRSGIAQPGAEPKLIPVNCPVLACYYRADLLQAGGRKPPETWEQYQALLADLSNWSNGLPAYEPWSPEFRSTMFLARAASSALHPDNVSILLDLQSGRPLIGEPPFVQALHDILAALKQLDPLSLQSGPAECVRAVLEGRAAMAIGTPPDTATDVARDPGAVIGTIQLPGATRVYERTANAWTPAPDGAPSYVTLVGFGGYACCAARSADEATRSAGWSLWESAQQDADDQGLPFGPAVCRQRDVPAAMQLVQSGLTAAEWQEHVEATIGALQETRVLLDFPLPQPGRFHDLLSARLTEAIDGATPVESALEHAAADWQALIIELGDRRVLDVYRQCHGLSPL